MSKTLGAAGCAILLFAGATLAAVAQSDAVRSLYVSSATISTNVEGIKTFTAPPAEFNALKASNEALATYAFPPRPDPLTSASAFAAWQRAMTGIQAAGSADFGSVGRTNLL